MFLNIFKSKKDVKNNFYFGLILKEEEGTGMIIELDEATHTVRKIDEKKFTYSNGWEQLVEDVDQVLYDLETRNSLELKKVIFFLYSHLIDQSKKQIKKNYDKRIKSIAEELTIEPLGFIEYHEAISLFQAEKDEAPLTSIIVELDKPIISVFIYKAGDLFFSDSIGKTEDIVSDLEMIFLKIKGTVLPARIILYDSTSLITESHKIASHKFNEELFIQLPKVEILREQDLTDALLNSFSRQVFDNDSKNAPEKQPAVATDAAPHESMGFVIGEDIKSEKDIPPTEFVTLRHKAHVDADFEYKESKSGMNYFQNTVSSLYAWFKKPDMNGGRQTMKLNIPIVMTISLLVVIFLATAILYFSHKATLIVYFEGKKTEKELSIDGVFSENTPQNGKLAISQIEKKLEQTESINTTGKKTIGQKATGAITIYNKDASDKTFKKGDVLASTSGIKFILDTDVKVASASESLTSEGNVLTVTGKAKGQVTAEVIGPSGNIKKGEKLKVGDFSDSLFFALTESAFTGGSKEEVKTASKEDIALLHDKVIAKMKTAKNATDKANTSNQQKRIDVLTSVMIDNEDYSHEVGEEADTVTLKAKGKVIFYQYNDDSLKKLVASIIQEAVSKEYELLTSNISYTITAADKKDSKEIVMKLKAVAQLVPKNDTENIKTLVAGKSENDVKNITKEKIKAQGFKINVDTPIPFLKSRMPFFKQNIQVQIDSL